MASNGPDTKGRSATDAADVAAMSMMARIAERAGSVRSLVRRTPPPAPAPAPGAGVTTAQLVNARLLLSEQNVIGKTRLRFAKRVVMRYSRLFTHRLVRAGQDLADAIELLEITHGRAIGEVKTQLETGSASGNASMVDRITKLELDLGRLSNSLHAQLTSVELGVDDVAASVEGVTALIGEASATMDDKERGLAENARGLDVRLSAMERSALHDRSELHRTRTLVSRLVRTASTQISASGEPIKDPAPAAGPALTPGAPATLDDSTYVDFEHRFRGTRDEIRSRQQDAVPFVSGFAGTAAPVLDLGCGRGEWLDLLTELKVKAYGVDSNTAMVAEALEAGLDARVGDALAHLEKLPESSLQAVTAFQFVEHIPMDVLVKLLDSALLALRPGGVLLLETPNPTNLIVGAANFYLDPTHLRVLHPDFLAFLVESRGFVDVEVHYVHPVIEESVLKEGERENGDADARLTRVVRNVEWALFGPQDYLLHARRAEVA